MKITEVRDGFIKLEVDESVYLSSFVRITGSDRDYIAQIINIKSGSAAAKILFTITDGELSNYDNTAPSKDSEVVLYTREILDKSVRADSPVIIGKTFDNSCNIVVDSSVFNKKMLISTDDVNMSNLLLQNFARQFDNLGINTVIIDTDNIVKAQKYYAGKDFKLPLNKTTVQYLYQACNKEATPDSRQMIAEVFNDLSEYFDSVPFVPLGVLKSIVDDMVDKQHIFKLFVLKNKLSYLSKLGYFAENKTEAESINKLLDSNTPVVDISSVDAGFRNYFLEYLYTQLKSDKTQVFLITSNIVSKHNLKTILTESDVPTTLVVNSRYRYLDNIKAMFDNFIIEPTVNNKAVFRVYNSFLSSMEQRSYLITGEGINYIPIISKAQIIEEVVVSEQKSPIELNPPEINEQLPEENTEDTDISAIEQEEIAEDNEISVKEQPSQEDILANIEQKSEQIIDSISESAEDIENIDLFDEDESDEEVLELVETEEIDDEDENDAEENDTELLTSDDNAEDDNDNIIEPEYEELSDVTEAGEEITEVPDEEESESVTEIENIADSGDTNKNEILEYSQTEELVMDEELSVLDGEIGLSDISMSDTPELSEDAQETEASLYTEGELSENNISNEQISEYDNIDETITEEPEELVLDNYEEVSDLSPDMDELSLNIEMQEIKESDDKEYDDNSGLESLTSDDDIALEEIVELNPDEADENDIIIDISDEEENININDDIDQQIMEDVDKVYTTMKESDEADDISDSDLDLIDELNSDSDEGLLEEYSDTLNEEILEQPSESIIPERQPQKHNQEILEKRDSNTPIVPVYDADIPQEDMVLSDSIQQGDSVVHAKYGNGIVEKMIKYGTKTLFSINFENIGRRLLDPTLTEIKKL